MHKELIDVYVRVRGQGGLEIQQVLEESQPAVFLLVHDLLLYVS